MSLTNLTRIIYALLGVLYVVIGVGSMLVPTGWIPEHLGPDALMGKDASPFMGHLLQEFGTVVITLGLLFLWRAKLKEYSSGFHWAVTFYFALDSLIHWVGPEGPIGSWQRGIPNSIPLAVMVVLGALQLRESKKVA